MKLLKFHRTLCKGFTLIELIMTILIVGVIAVPLSLFLIQNIEGVFRSKEYTLVMNLARLEMERVNNLPYNRITTTAFPNYEGYNYDVDRQVRIFPSTLPVPANVELKEVRVTVRRPRQATSILSLITYVTDFNGYGS